MTSTTLLLVLLAAAGLTMAYVSPDDQGRSNTGQRSSVEVPRTHLRAKPEPLSAQQYDNSNVAEGLRFKRGEKVPRSSVMGSRRARGIDTGSGSGSGSFAGSGSFSNSGGGSGGYQTSGGGNFPGFGFGAGGQYPAYPFHNPNPAMFMPADFGTFFQYLQQMQNAIQQNAVNQGITNSYGIATRNGVFGPNGYGSVSSSGYGGNGNGFSGGYGGGFGYGGYGNGGGNDGSNFIGYSQGGQGGQGGSNGFEGASAVASIGPQGGYGSANLNPEIGSRFGSDSGQFPAPNGGNVGVFTGSSSSSSNVNGQTKTFRTATAGHIDSNGKVTSYTVRDPPKK